ncbi:7385_t:CDS:2, partial [Gigaspora rosea]
QEQILQAFGQSSSSHQSGFSSDQSDPQVNGPFRLIKRLNSYKGDTSNFEHDINETVQNIKKLLKVIGTIDDCSTESEKAEFISAVLIGVLSTFDKRDENILCIIEAKAQNIEHGLCQNF